MIRLYDTAQREKVPLQPLEQEKLGIYVCGPTVYDMCHVGHARCYVAFDVVVRHLRHRGYQVTYVRNVTDVDDKIIARATELSEDPIALAARYTREFHTDMELLGNRSPDVEPRVSDHIPEVIGLIQRIIDNGCGYVVDGDVYFEVGRFDAYGGLSRRNLDELRSGARVEVDQRKRSPLDFALWKAAKPGEPTWDSPWGPGRPGWHIECSAMSSRYLGPVFDIHGGGMDLIFPHHENEIAQSRSVTGGDSFARLWLHNGFINVRTPGDEEEKMSKSLGNFFTIREVTRHHHPEALRLYLLGTHYRKPLTFEVDRSGDDGVRFVSLEDAERRLTYTYTTLGRLREALAVGKTPGPGEVLEPAADFAERFCAALDDDFNTAAALGLSSELLTLANKLLDQPRSAPKDVRRRTLQAVLQGLELVGEVLGVFGQDPAGFLAHRRQQLCQARGIDPAAVERGIQQRTAARKARDFARADQLRDELTAMGVELMDGPAGTTWRVSEDQN
jgi:cysteinyl-tRNA synthetase